MKLLQILALVKLTRAFLETPPRNGTIPSKAFVSPILSTDVITSESNFVEPPLISIPHSFQQELSQLEQRLGAEGTVVDVKSGKVEALTFSEAILPGDGVNNRLLWGVSTLDDGAHGPPSTEDLETLAIQSVKLWMNDHAAELQVNVTELFSEGTVRTAVHGNGDMIQLSIPRIYRGIPIVGARAMATIKLGNLIEVGFEDWGDIPADFDLIPKLSEEDAREILARHLELTLVGREDKCGAELQILTLTPGSTEFGQGYEYVLAWRICPLFEGQDVEVMEGLIDAHTGTVYSFVDKVHYLTARGGVYPISNDGRSPNGIPDGIEQPGWPMPYMYVENTVTDTGGNYDASGSVTGEFIGPYVTISDKCGSSSLTSSSGLDWGTSGGTDCTTPGIGGKGNTHSARTNFYELNKVIEMAKSHLPNNKWLKERLRVNLNINDSCNAWWLNTINFYREGNGCGNTGELVGVIVHEWGHGLDDNDVEGRIASPSGEGIADIYAALRMGDSCIGRGFFQTNAQCTGVRQVDYVTGSGRPKTMSNNNCRGSVHCLGGVYSEAVWSLYKRYLQQAPYNYDDNTALEIVTRLTFIAAGNVGTWFKGNAPWGGCGAASGYREYIAADDDNGNLNDGTPHMTAIYDAFNEHEIACNSPTIQDSGCNEGPEAAPEVTVTPGNMEAIISWTPVVGASKYEVFRTEGLKECGQGKVRLTTTTSLSYSDDSGLMNGREYYYIVIPKGPNDSCFGPSSVCVTVEPSEVPVPTTPAPTRKPSPPTISPTAAPTRRCGNGFCELDESSTSCSVDCTNRELSVLTDSSRGAPGIMFWVTAASRDIEVSSFKFNTWEVTNTLVEIYTRTGTYTGYEQDDTGWQLVFEDTVQLNGDGGSFTELNLSNKVEISSDATHSFFIWLDQGNMQYEAGVSEGDLLGSDDFVSFYTGAGITAKFDGSQDDVYSPRRFSGIMSYDVVSSISTSNPTDSPITSSPTERPITSSPTERPITSPPTSNPTDSPVTSSPTRRPITSSPTARPVTSSPTDSPVTSSPTVSPVTLSPTSRPSTLPVTSSPSANPTQSPITSSPTSSSPVTPPPTSLPTKSPTPLPSSSCGSGTCEPHESTTSCPADCSNIVWTAHDQGNSGANGIMFNLMATRDVVVNSFDVYTDAVRNGLIEVYTRPDGYSGHEVDAAGWTAVFTKSVDQNGRTIPTSLGQFDTPVTIRAGEVQAFYIYSSDIIMYDTGNDDGGVFGSDVSLTIYQGAGIASVKFPGSGAATDVVYSPRVFKGNILYDAVTLTTEPTVAPSQKPTTLTPTLKPSSPPVTNAPTNTQSCFDLTTQEACAAAASCRWRSVIGTCRRKRNVGTKTSKRVGVLP